MIITTTIAISIITIAITITTKTAVAAPRHCGHLLALNATLQVLYSYPSLLSLLISSFFFITSYLIIINPYLHIVIPLSDILILCIRFVFFFSRILYHSSLHPILLFLVFNFCCMLFPLPTQVLPSLTNL